MDVPLIVAGCLGIVGAGIHGVGGEVLVVRKLSQGTLPPTSFGGPRATRAMIHAAWHMTTVAFLTVGTALLLSGTVIGGDAAQGIAVVAASASTGFAAVALGLGVANTRSARALLRHPGPPVLLTVTVLAWWGASGF
jgi:hypothetical protein